MSVATETATSFVIINPATGRMRPRKVDVTGEGFRVEGVSGRIGADCTGLCIIRRRWLT